MAVGGKAPLDPDADMLANVDVLGRPVPTARFMGGREFAVLAGDRPAEAHEADVAAIVASGVMAMPAFSDQGGPFAGRKGRIEGEAPATPPARTALATLYVALMTAHVLDLLEAPGDIIVEGGFNRSPAFAAVLAASCPAATWSSRRPPAPPKARRCSPAGASRTPRRSSPRPRRWRIPGLTAYRERWERALLDARNREAR